jgi:hypothetical protein
MVTKGHTPEETEDEEPNDCQSQNKYQEPSCCQTKIIYSKPGIEKKAMPI